MNEPKHYPKRPAWTCLDCGEPWPCQRARDRLTAETGGGTALAVLLSTYLGEFVRDLPGRTEGSFDRFLGWTRAQDPGLK